MIWQYVCVVCVVYATSKFFADFLLWVSKINKSVPASFRAC